MASVGPVLILGGRGQVGRAVEAAAGERRVLALGRAEADVTEAAAIDALLARRRPAAVVNCAVFQPVDLCESEPEQAFAVNAVAPGRVADACAARGVPLVHLSTDYVFAGDRRRPWLESDCPRPLSVYGASKRAGETLVVAASPRHCVVRTSAVFGPHGGQGSPPFAERMLARALAGQATRVVDDQVVSPTATSWLAGAIWTLLDAGAGGIVHVAGGGPATWYEVARRVFAAAGREELLEPTSSRDFGAPARRPPFSALASERREELGLPAPPAWQELLDDHLRRAHPGVVR